MTMTSVSPLPDPSQRRTSSWREIYPVHPCADVFPMMSDAEIDALAADIKEHGLQKPIVLWRDGDTPSFVLDGRNRLAALERLGVSFTELRGVVFPDGYTIQPFTFQRPPMDPPAYVIGANIHRRHLTKEQQAELILRTIEASKIDRATTARSFNTTTGKKGGSTKDPVLAKAVTEAQKHDISKRTVQTARAKLQGKVTPTGAGKHPREKVQSATGTKAGMPRPITMQDQINESQRLVEELKAATAAANLTAAERAAQRPLAFRMIDAGFKALARDVHPDTGGSPEDMTRLNAVRDRLKRCIV
jgi:hypothetical protein